MAIHILPQPAPTNSNAPPPAQTTPFSKPADGSTLYWVTMAPENSYRPYLVQVVALDGSVLKFQFVSLADLNVCSGTETIDLRLGKNVWGDPSTTDSLPSTLKGATAGQYAFLFLSDDGVKTTRAPALSGGTGKWPLSSYGTNSVVLKYLPAIYKLVTENSKLTAEEMANLNELMKLFGDHSGQAPK